MKELKSVLKHLNKEEVNLASEKVELASTSEISSLTTMFKNNVENLSKEYDEYFKLRKSVKSGFSRASQIGQELEQMVLEFSKNAKELGISPDSVKEYKQAKQALDKSFPVLKDMKKFIR